jgi:7-cyano-7-deazaguanine synthase
MKPEMPLPLILLYGGGVESAALLEHLLAEGWLVWPVYEHWGLHWDDCTLMHTHRACQLYQRENLHPLIEVRDSRRDLLADHWSVTGSKIPQAGDPPLAMEIPARNSTLLAIAAAQFPSLPELHFVIGTTADNKFSDGTRTFFNEREQAMSIDCRRPVTIMTPLINMSKHDVIRRCDPAILALSFSCVNPLENRHCGLCYKCGRRKQAFQQAGVKDPTIYVH